MSAVKKQNLIEEIDEQPLTQSKEETQVCEYTTQPVCNCEEGMSTDRFKVKKQVNSNIVPEVTHELLKNCNVIREKSLGSRNL